MMNSEEFARERVRQHWTNIIEEARRQAKVNREPEKPIHWSTRLLRYVACPFGILLIILNFYLLRGRQRFGIIYESNFKVIDLFVPCSVEAREVLHRYCKKYKKDALRFPFPFGAYIVKKSISKQIYEAIMHDPVSPQCMSMHCRLGLITDTP